MKIRFELIAFLIFLSFFSACAYKNVQVEKKEMENARNEVGIEKQVEIENFKKQIESQQREIDELKKELEREKKGRERIVEKFDKIFYNLYKSNKLIYHNDDYGFSIEIPEKKLNIKFNNVIQDKTEENIEILNFQFSTKDENDMEVAGTLFEIIVCKNNATYPGVEFLGKRGDIAFYFIDSSYDTESSAIKALIEELKPMLEEIKVSFRFDE